jgi:hypothetical protein
MRACVGGNIAVVLFCLTYLCFGYKSSGVTPPYIAASVLVGYFLADFASGLVHWGVDTWFSEEQFGRAILIAREHHTHPQNILGYGFLEQATLGSAPSAVVIGPIAIATALIGGSGGYLLMIVWAVCSMCLLFGTSFHNLGHRRSKSVLIRAAQKMRLVVSPEHHWAHHREGQLIRYCAVNGWANYLCDKFGVWRKLERWVHAATGAVPRGDDDEWQRFHRETGALLLRKRP